MNKFGSINNKNKDSFSNRDKPFLHGHLLVEVKEAKCLPDMESWISKVVDKNDVTDAYVDIPLGKAKLAQTSVITNSLNPVWNESYRIEVCHFAHHLRFSVADKDHISHENIGTVDIPVQTLLSGHVLEGSFPICKSNGKPTKDASLSLRVQFVSRNSVAKTYEVECYFPVQRNNHVTLYQDAHALDMHQMPQFNSLAQQMPHLSSDQVIPRSCWTDLYAAIMESRHVICITGWAVWSALKLFRGTDTQIDPRTLGEILIAKADAGVNIYVMIWSEITSGEFKEEGMMGTHDMETFNYFKETKVNCALAARDMSVNEVTDVVNHGFSSGCYTHHQKSVICDAPGFGPKRRLVAFVGGLDLTGGRYDTPNHELFSTLLDEHENDFRNKNAQTVPPNQGPREPWHDIHSKVEGPIAHDVYLNFLERWKKQGVKYEFGKKLVQSVSEFIDINCPAVITNPNLQWNCQLFRSITSDSAIFEQQKTKILNSKKGRMVDSSIAQAYIQMIRNAENFIYIENQYFLGSAYCWLDCDDTNCHHTIPSEITQRICEKIERNQRFIAYIVIPMFPEGDPTSAAIQEILHWQYKTMEMMYQRVGEALKIAGSPTHPTDWLIFLCLGKREPHGPHLDRLEPANEASAKIFRQSLRFPIYVHSKMMIVDDVYIIVGSANINQRSLSGTRDTEMAVGCWQPGYVDNNPYGEVHRFRMSLWTEHFRLSDAAFIHPASSDCITKVKEYTKFNWQMYVGPHGSITPGQILPYPIGVMSGGEIKTLDNFPIFPDFPAGSKVQGKISAFLPQKLTT